jgi:zinc transporter ZupT
VALAGIATAFATGLGALPIGAAAERGQAWRPALLGAAAGAMVVVSLVGLPLPAHAHRRRTATARCSPPSAPALESRSAG